MRMTAVFLLAAALAFPARGQLTSVGIGTANGYEKLNGGLLFEAQAICLSAEPGGATRIQNNFGVNASYCNLSADQTAKFRDLLARGAEMLESRPYPLKNQKDKCAPLGSIGGKIDVAFETAHKGRIAYLELKIKNFEKKKETTALAVYDDEVQNLLWILSDENETYKNLKQAPPAGDSPVFTPPTVIGP
jgi:hypothetical protein